MLEHHLGRLLAFSVLLTALSFLVAQNSVEINIRLVYFINSLNDVNMRLGSALLISALLGFGLGWITARWRG
ncbi:hypothetical protein BH23CHL5_BH23CHL5_06820 [soil metagenome]